MNNTDKLLRAFIEASGYEIEKTVDDKSTPISKQSGIEKIKDTKGKGLLFNYNGYVRGKDGCYYIEPSYNVDYKVTKKEKSFKVGVTFENGHEVHRFYGTKKVEK